MPKAAHDAFDRRLTLGLIGIIQVGASLFSRPADQLPGVTQAKIRNMRIGRGKYRLRGADGDPELRRHFLIELSTTKPEVYADLIQTVAPVVKAARAQLGNDSASAWQKIQDARRGIAPALYDIFRALREWGEPYYLTAEWLQELAFRTVFDALVSGRRGWATLPPLARSPLKETDRSFEFPDPGWDPFNEDEGEAAKLITQRFHAHLDAYLKSMNTKAAIAGGIENTQTSRRRGPFGQPLPQNAKPAVYRYTAALVQWQVGGASEETRVQIMAEFGFSGRRELECALRKAAAAVGLELRPVPRSCR